MTLHELLKPMQDINLEVHYYKNHEHYKEGHPCEEIEFQTGDCNSLSIRHFNHKVRVDNKIVDWDNCEVFYVGYTTTRSRILRINVEATDFND